MTDIRISNMDGGGATELKGSSVALEKSLQAYMEQNLEALLSITLLKSEYSTGKTHGGRIDTLGIDENGFPVIIEYKRAINENVINQGLFYIDWLLDHKGEFELRVLKKLGKEWGDKIDWTNTRLLCMRNSFKVCSSRSTEKSNLGAPSILSVLIPAPVIAFNRCRNSKRCSLDSKALYRFFIT